MWRRRRAFGVAFVPLRGSERLVRACVPNSVYNRLIFCEYVNVLRRKVRTMKKILLCCNAGITSSLLVVKLRSEVEARGLDIEVDACSMLDAVNRLGDTDLLLLGPQVGYAKGDFDETANEKGAVVDVIDAGDYARTNASAILDAALARLGL